MAVRTSYPGVYIDEFAPAPPIQGVGTSTAAFIGPAARGDIGIPVKITRWETFLSTFGEAPLPGRYLWYAVRGFFENGGQICYVVRASNAAYAGIGTGGGAPAALPNKAGNPALTVRARNPGNPQPPIQVQVVDSHLLKLAETSLYRPAGNFTVSALREVTLTSANEALRFRPGDWINLGGADARVQIASIGGTVVRVVTDLATAQGNAGTIRLADPPVGTQTIRVASTVQIPDGSLLPGTMLTITQGPPAAPVLDTQIVASVRPEGQPEAGLWSYRVTLRQGLAKPFSLDPAQPVAAIQSEEFDLHVQQGATTVYPGLALDPAHQRYYLNVVNESAGLVMLRLVEPPPIDPPPLNMPGATAAPMPLGGGGDENLATLNDNHYIAALNTLSPIDDVNLIAIPDATGSVVQQQIIAHCELQQDRFGVLDSRRGLPPFTIGAVAGVDGQRRSVVSVRGYAALYYPWISVPAADGGPPLLVPPSGHVCGVIAKVDSASGVFKAPANVFLNGAIDIQPNGNLSNIEQGELNLQGINVIRVFQGGGRPMIWGARTTATDLNWQYVSTRRLFLFLEESIQEGIRWAVFEPNNQALWQRLKRTLNDFLRQQWRDGALYGATEEQAFDVRIDEDLNPFGERQLGRLTMVIRLQPAFTVEFVIVRIGIWDGGAEITEG